MKNKRNLIKVLFLSLLITVACTCGLTDKLINQAVGGGENYQSVPSLWSDVPQMEGMQPSQVDNIPPFIKLALRLVIGNLGRLNPQGQDQTTGNIDWIAYTTDKAPTDVQNFYTNDLMVSNGWDSSESAPCVSGSDQGNKQVGVICVFQKTQNGKNIQLAIITAQDDQTKKTNIFYLRLEENPTPVPSTTP